MARSTFSGPISGTYATLVFTCDDLIAAESISYRMAMPFDCKVMETCAQAGAITGPPQYHIQNATDVADIVAARAITGSSEVLTPTSTPALAARSLTKGEVLLVEFLSNATGTIEGGCIVITLWIQGHVVTSEEDD